MRKLGYLVLFLVLTAVALYFTFPFDRLVGYEACKRGLSFSSVEVKRLPPEVVFRSVCFGSLPVCFERLSVEPRGTHRFRFYAEACGGSVGGELTYPVGKVEFKAEGLKLGRCGGDLKGKLSGEGSLELKGGKLVGGSGELLFSNLEVSNLKFGLFSFETLRLGRVTVKYRVEGVNRVKLTVTGSGPDALLRASGYLNVNPANPASSYLNAKVHVTAESGDLKGKSFTFTLRGTLKDLEVL
ncbi:hypothetical protein [Thermovibrio ammonificans]